jgi:uncharacterized protein VirK/YbjX
MILDSLFAEGATEFAYWALGKEQSSRKDIQKISSRLKAMYKACFRLLLLLDTAVAKRIGRSIVLITN